ncbi:PadR family transcriptional regulator [Oleomonas cavernae]|uniref:PadR family transcriptional regulator n=1 Tax=Oleomonas cavernae TaxID=2320859 RepID=A0A418WTL8_9PROT|nr:PadR family transcriptional regulator [Oleomonas cavernae]RJF94613.1 PadR family transcriptional regulator [Oleomonas cavernae]
MSLPHALLTALLEHPCSGSELASRFDRSIGYFWQSTHQQIYRELGRLEAAGWIESLAPEGGRGRKRAYRVLPAGRQELKRWVGESNDPKPLRNELMVRLRAEAVVGPTGIARDIERQMALHLAQLALYREIETRDFSRVDPTKADALRHLVLTAGIMTETLWVEFCRQALAVLAAPGD